MTTHTSDFKAGKAEASKGRFRKVIKLARLLRVRSWRRALFHRVAATTEHRNVFFGERFATVIDIGAHHGQFGLLIRELYPDAQLICVEPVPDSVTRLRRVLGAYPRVTIISKAVSDAQGHGTIHISRKTDSSSLREILPSYISAFPGTHEAATATVPLTTLGDLFAANTVARPTLLKLDVQGCELDILRSAPHLLSELDAVFVECSFVTFYRGQGLADEVIAFCLEYGLRLVGVYSVVVDSTGNCLQADLLFRRTLASG